MAPAADIFNVEAARYDAWFDTPRGRVLFANELAAIRALWRDEFRPALEVGVGTGRFAAALGVEHGVDPAAGALRLAAARGVRVEQARGEALPLADGTMGAVLLIASLCFVQNPASILREAARVLRADGHVLVGDVPAGSAWGQLHARKRAAGHAFYRHARLYAVTEIDALLAAAGFVVSAAASTLATPPEDPPRVGGAAVADRRVVRIRRAVGGTDQSLRILNTAALRVVQLPRVN